MASSMMSYSEQCLRKMRLFLNKAWEHEKHGRQGFAQCYGDLAAQWLKRALDHTFTTD